ncbi:cytochrome oxidase assembly protein ShyY1 [Reinekea marinisedimentorum]|uniref:SURF1-like protein n=2 Tax=Reinekea marinisedimentorum TaxID=230495 RepID=A0A4R3I6V6_9GAMM|nr:cytochrome oxidase assembly protein ShyY1 [Reinekea marinisedimentorum]
MASISFNIFRHPSRPEQKRFAPGLWLSLFTGFFLPLFIVLGFWQLSRAEQKAQWFAELNRAPVSFNEMIFNEQSLYKNTLLSAQPMSETVFLLDNKTHNGQVGYEHWCLFNTGRGVVAGSLGWVAGFADRSQLPQVNCKLALNNQPATLRTPPQNPLFSEQANSLHSSQSNIWIVQALSSDWLQPFTGEPVVAFVQLNNLPSAINIWQPSTITPEKHLAYAIQWFAMAAALAAMFIFAGVKFSKRSGHDSD